jgi:hypothetical protein
VGKQSCELPQDYPEAKNLPSSSLGRFSVVVAQCSEGSCQVHLAIYLNRSLQHPENDIAELVGQSLHHRGFGKGLGKQTGFSRFFF